MFSGEANRRIGGQCALRLQQLLTQSLARPKCAALLGEKALDGGVAQVVRAAES